MSNYTIISDSQGHTAIIDAMDATECGCLLIDSVAVVVAAGCVKHDDDLEAACSHGLTEDDTNSCDSCGLLAGSCCGVADDWGLVLCGPCYQLTLTYCEACKEEHPGRPHSRD